MAFRTIRRNLATLVAVAIAAIDSRGDISVVTVFGPNTGSAFSNLGVAARTEPVAAMEDANVTIELGPGPAEDLVARCTATFLLTVRAAPNNKPQETLVAFPVTGQHAGAVTIDSFTVKVDGVSPEVRRRPVRLGPLASSSPKTSEIQATLENIERGTWLIGNDDVASTQCYFDSYFWKQVFQPNTHSTVIVTYRLTLHPQALTYSKRYAHGSSGNPVPFELMMLPNEAKKGYFFDYILRSGSTWFGPIGHEVITLTVDPQLNIAFEDEATPFVRRQSASDYVENTYEGQQYYRARVDPDGLRYERNRLVWEIKNAKPTNDILVEIPFNVVKHVSTSAAEIAPGQKPPG